MEKTFTITVATSYKEDYQMAMLKMNELKGIIPVRGMGINDKSEYHFHTSGKISLLLLLEEERLSVALLKTFASNLLTACKETDRFLLYEEKLMLTPEDIYYDGTEFSFCYFPGKEIEAKAELRKLADYFVTKLNHQDEELISRVYFFYELATKGDCHLPSLLKEYLAFTPPKKVALVKERVDQEARAGTPPGKIREGSGKFFKRRKKNKWGNFDDLFIDEEL
ncbi:hypothetical protein M2150_002096 [Lachnospiraceae bacterium PM6-15]|uniref:DUF6382 domain-containing protein n=1 Tax=Ohessyouella blattaphilus TaxID=2949333 RepID=A0ABT1EH46_9FIRM|nr:DUF6382 domain-containing protein [Ohessyouella blattaphilus]MCP1110019.1 DUF6382 domain-containing protein [Ohessyouella blattaphilus]MCR8563413.1 DUF6382 domain-containing protein [Ohessyouella blattaphilus]MDL2249155.1 DUF6382 domain-containing protein [Lachnospiraceae bacterium OttesenSCG-928-J05]